MKCSEKYKEKWCHHLGKGDYCIKYQEGNCEKEKKLIQIIILDNDLYYKKGDFIFSDNDEHKIGKIIYMEDTTYLVETNKSELGRLIRAPMYRFWSDEKKLKEIRNIILEERRKARG